MAHHVRFQPTPFKQCIIEFQAFIGNSNEYILKELVIMDLDTNVVNYFLFKPPHSIKKLSFKAIKTNKWLTKNYHHINWNEGFTEYKEVDNVMYHYCSQYNTIYTTGLKKCQFIQQYTTNTVQNYKLNKLQEIDVGEGFCNSVKSTKHKTTNCSLVKAFKVITYLRNNVNVGGDEPYIKEYCTMTTHELYAYSRPDNIVVEENGFSPSIARSCIQV